MCGILCFTGDAATARVVGGADAVIAVECGDDERLQLTETVRGYAGHTVASLVSSSRSRECLGGHGVPLEAHQGMSFAVVHLEPIDDGRDDRHAAPGRPLEWRGFERAVEAPAVTDLDA